MNTIVTNYGTMRLRPLHDRILVQRIEQPESRLIVIPDTARENTQIGEVIAAGPEAYGVTEGDIVLLPGVASKYPDWSQKDIILVRLGDVGGILQVSYA